MPSTLKSPIPFEEPCEVIPDDEGHDAQQVVEALKKILRYSHAKSGQFQRDVHVKSSGCAFGNLEVLPNLPPELAQGLFRNPQRYTVNVRFSNGAGQVNPDWIPDARGLAIKVMEVGGERLPTDGFNAPEQDFVLVNHPVFIARNVKDYLRLEELVVETFEHPLSAIPHALSGGSWNPLEWHWNEAVTAIQIAAKVQAHPASNTYFSMSPIRYGQYVAKYRVKPCRADSLSLLQVSSKLFQEPDALRMMLEETLRSNEISFDFQVQLRTSRESMPIEDSTIEWPEAESAYRTVAILRLLQQEIATVENAKKSEELVFNVWNGIQEHRPLGGINRLRREVYAISAAWRRKPAHEV